MFNSFATVRTSGFPVLSIAILSLGIASYSNAQSIFEANEIAFVEQWLPRALESDSQENLAAGELMAEAHYLDIESNDILRVALDLDLDLDNLSLLVSLATHCGEDSVLLSCDLAEVTQALAELDSDNAYPFLLASMYYESVGDTSAALMQLQSAGSKSRFDDYLIPRAEFLIRKLREIGYPEENLLERAFFYGGDNFASVYQGMLLHCEKYVESDLNWKNACIELGLLMENYGRTFVAVRFGQAMQRSMYSFDPADANLLNAVQRRRAFSHRWRVLFMQDYESLIGADKAQFYQDQIDRDELYAMNEAFQRLAGRRDPDSFLNRNIQ